MSPIGEYIRYGYAVVPLATIIDATGLPFPGRLLLIVAGAMSRGSADTFLIIVLGALGALIGDHVLYSAGRLGKHKVLSLFCRVTLGSGRCIEKTQSIFQRYGAPSVILGRFFAGIRLFAAPLAGSGAIPYWKFLTYDVVGALLWSGGFVMLGHILGDQWAALVDRWGGGTVTVGVTLLMLGAFGATFLARLRRRGRHGAASLSAGNASCHGEAGARPSRPPLPPST
jgi:membrane protein DedA with SNARE-associated domain